MANLATAVPSMQSGDPQGSSGDAIVTEKSFVNFANSFDKLSPKLTSNRKKTQRVRERIDLMMERRMRRMGAPQKVKDEVEEDDEASGGALSSISSALGGIIKGMLVFLKTVGKWLMKNLLGFGPIGIAAKAAIAALFTKAGLIAGAAILGTIGVGFLAKEVIDIFKSKKGSGASGEEDDLGPVEDDELEPGSANRGVIPSIQAPEEIRDRDEEVADFVGDGDDTEAPSPEPVVEPVVAPVPKLKPPPPPAPTRPAAAAPKRPAAAAPKRPAAAAPKRPAAAAPKPVPLPKKKPPPPERAPTQLASMKVGEPVKATVKASGGSGGESSSDLKKKVEDLYRIENVNRRAYQEAKAAQNKIDVRDTNDNKKYPQGYQIGDPNGEDYNSEAAAADKKKEQAHEKWIKSRDKWEAAQKRLKALKKKEDDDFEKGFDDKEFEMDGDGSTKTASSGSSTTTVKKQEKVVKTKTETVTGGGSTLRKSAETVKSPEAKKLEAEAAVLKKQRNELKKRLKAKGMRFSQWSRDPQIRALTKKIRDLEIKADRMPGIVVKRGSTTRTPGKNIRKSSKKVIIKPVIIAKETRVRA